MIWKILAYALTAYLSFGLGTMLMELRTMHAASMLKSKVISLRAILLHCFIVTGAWPVLLYLEIHRARKVEKQHAENARPIRPR